MKPYPAKNEQRIQEAAAYGAKYYYDHLNGKYPCHECGAKGRLKLVLCEHRDRRWLCAVCEKRKGKKLNPRQKEVRAFTGRTTPKPRAI